MATDRLTALIAQPQRDPARSSYKLGTTQQTTNDVSDRSLTYRNDSGNGTLDNFYDEVSNVQGLTNQFGDNVARITESQGRADGSGQKHAWVDDQVAQILDLGNRIKRRIEALNDQPIPGGQETRRNQVNEVASQFMAALQNYMKAGEDYRHKQRAWIEKQFRNIKPDTTPEEVTAVVENTDGTGGQIFSQALSIHGQSRALYKEVQDHHEDIKKIEHTLEELAQLYNDMRVLVPQRDESIDSIYPPRVEGMGEVVVTAQASQKKWWKRWWFYLCIIIFSGIFITGTIIGALVAKDYSSG